MKKLAFTFLMFALSTPALADGKQGEGIRAMANLGPWIGMFKQSDQFGHVASFTTKTSLGFGFQMGWNFSPIFVEYNFNWLLSASTLSMSTDSNSNRQPHARDAVYYSLAGLNVGASLPGMPFEPFVGVEKAGFGLSAGSRTDYGGVAGKLGANVYFNESLGVKAEFKRLWIAGDDVGFFPEGISARADIISASLVFGKR